MNMVMPRVHFCWLCGKKLQGNSHVERVIDGHPRILHKTCAQSLNVPDKLPTATAFPDPDDDYMHDVDYLEDQREDE